MIINATIDLKPLKARTQREQKRLAFNTAQALNETAKKIQTAERVNLDRKLQLRKAGFMYRLIKITAFASARAARPFAEIAIDPSKRRVLLGKLERGGVKEPERGKTVAVPLTGGAARPGFAQPVPVEMQLVKLRFKRHRTALGKTQWKGLKRTFIIPKLGVFQRGGQVKTEGRKTFVGKRGRKLKNTTLAKLIYSFERRPQLKKMLEFMDVAARTFRVEWQAQFKRSYNK